MVLPAGEVRTVEAVAFRRAAKGAVRLWRAGLAVGWAATFASAAYAQVTPVAPTREEVTRPTAPAEAPPRARLTIEGDVPRAPCALDRPEYQSIRFTPTGAEFANLRGLSPEALREAYASYLGSEQPVSVVCEIRDRAAAILRNAGYVAAVEVPEQRIADGVIRFNVVQAKLVGLRVRGDAGRAERVIAGYLNRLTEEEVFNRFTAERYLLLAGDLPGFNVRLALRSAGTARGEVIGEVTVLRTPASADLTILNYGSRQLGRWGGLARVQFFGLTGMGDSTTVSFFSTADFDEQQTLNVAHEFRLGGEGLAVRGQATYAWGHPDLGDPAINIRSRTMFATLELGYPFIRRQDVTLRGAAGFDYIDQDLDFNDLALNQDHLRVGYIRVDFDKVGLSNNIAYSPVEPRWRLGASAELRQGFDIFDASPACGPALVNCIGPGIVPPSRLDGDPTGTLIRGGIYGEYRPMPRLTFSLGVRGQYSGDALFAFEEFSGGNYTIGRGFDPGAILGDSGIGFQAEVRYGSAVPRARNEVAVEPFIFYDHGWAWNEDSITTVTDQELSSIGGGARIAWGDKMRLEMIVAIPLERAGFQTERGDPRFLITLTTRLWPWSFR